MMMMKTVWNKCQIYSLTIATLSFKVRFNSVFVKLDNAWHCRFAVKLFIPDIVECRPRLSQAAERSRDPNPMP